MTARDRLFALIALALPASELHAITWQVFGERTAAETEAEAAALAAEPRFAGVGTIFIGGSFCTAALISEEWILTATHCLGGSSDGEFELNGVRHRVERFVTRPDSDVALGKLATPLSGASFPATALYPYRSEVGNEIILVGFGGHGEAGNGQAGLDFTGEGFAVTNRIDSVVDQGGPVGVVLQFSNTRRGNSRTSLEGGTAPGDSGGPMFMEENGRLWIVGSTYGATAGVGFLHGRVSEYRTWIETNTGVNFNAVEWDTNPDTLDSQQGPGTWNLSNRNWRYSNQNFRWVGTYDAVFGSSSGTAGTVTLGDDLATGDITFDDAASGTYRITGTGRTLSPAAGARIETRAEAEITVSMTGSNVRKAGPATLFLGGDNDFSGTFSVAEGILNLTNDSTYSFATGAQSGSGNNLISGNGDLEVSGTFLIDTSATETSGLTEGQWNLVTTRGAPTVYGEGFSVAGWIEAAPGEWTKTLGSRRYMFAEATGRVTLSPSTVEFEDWIAELRRDGQPLPANERGRLADPDRDGIPNVLEFALGGNSLTADSDILPRLVPIDDDTLMLEFRRAVGSIGPGTSMYVQSSTDAEDWTTLPRIAIGTSSDAQVTITENLNAPDDVIVVLPKSDDVRKFYRLQIADES